MCYGNKFDKVQVGKIDLDTCGAALLHGVSRKDKVEVLPGSKATEEDLANPQILCIEVGGSGRVAEGNFDHHCPGSEGLYSATRQAWENVPCWYCGGRFKGLDPAFIAIATSCCGGADQVLARIVEYIDILDTEGPQSLARRQQGRFPTLSDVFAGMLLVTREPVEQLHRGVEILREVAERLFTAPAFGRMPVEKVPGWDVYAEAKAKNNRQIRQAVKSAKWGKTKSGLKMAWLVTDFFGAPGALYGVGAQIVVAFSPNFGPNRVRKFTVAGNGIRVDSTLPELNALEPMKGWGGPSTGTIVGSPREGSKLTLKEIVEIVKKL